MMTKTQNNESAIKDIATVLHIVKRPADPMHLRQSQFNVSNQTHTHDSFILGYKKGKI